MMNPAPNSAMLFAAGLGTRMAGLTSDRPKPLVEVAGKSLLHHALDIVSQAKIEKSLVNTHYLAEMVHEHLHGYDVLTSFEPELLDTGGGLKAALPHLGNPVFTLNTDAIWTGGNPLNSLRKSWRQSSGALLLLTKGDDANFSMDDTGRLSRGGPWTYTGAQIIFTGPVARFSKERFSLNEIWNQLIAGGSLYGVPFEGRWCDVGTPDGIKRAERMLADG